MLLVLQDALLAADFTWTCRQGNVTNDDDQLRLDIVNNTAFSYEFRHEIGGAVDTDANPVGIPQSTVGGVPAGFTLEPWAVGTSGNSITPATTGAGATCSMHFWMKANNTTGANGPAADLTVSGAFYARKNGAGSWTRHTFSGTKNVQWNHSFSGNGLVGTQSIGSFNFTGVVPSGTITVSGLHGNFEAILKIDGVTVASLDQIPAPSNDSEEVAPDMVFSTSTPENYVGGVVELFINGYQSNWGAIEADANGNFALTISGPYEFTQRVKEIGDDEAVPMPGDDLELMPLEDPDHVRDAPGPISGSDPKTDDTVDSDGAGPGGGLSVRDNYRATRAAIEDALRTPNSPRFDFDDWRGTERADNSAAGIDAGASVGGVLGGLTGAVDGTGSMTLPGIGGSDPLILSVAGRDFTVPVPAGASLIRAFLMLLLSIFIFMRAVAIVRGAAAG